MHQVGLLQNVLRRFRPRVDIPVYPPPSRRGGARLVLQESPLAGFQYHRAHDVWPFLREGSELSLCREPSNPYDRNAIGVWFLNDLLGYVPRRENHTLAQLMDRGERLRARVVRLLDCDNPWRRIRFEVWLER